MNEYKINKNDINTGIPVGRCIQTHEGQNEGHGGLTLYNRADDISRKTHNGKYKKSRD